MQARQRRRTEEPASSSGRAPEPSWSWESWSRWDWQDDSWRGNRWKWTQASPDDDWEDRYYNDSDRQADDAADADIDVSWDDVSSDSSVHGHRGRGDASSNRSQPATKRSRSTQVSDEFVKRSVEPSPKATTGTATNDNRLTQLQRLEVIIDLLESLARSGLPTLINSFQRSGDFTKLHTVFHTDALTASFPRAGNWNLALVGSLLCPPLRGVYNNEEAFGSFMEAFTVCQARLQTRPRWFPQYQRLVSLVDALMATCTQATYDAMKWKINPAEFIHVVRVNEGAEAPAPGEAGDGHLRELLRGAATGSKDPPVMDEAPETPAPTQRARSSHPDNKVPRAEPLPLQALQKPPEEKPVDTLFSSDSDTVLILDKEKTESGEASSPPAHHRLRGGRAVRIPPAPPAPPSRQRSPSRERDTSGTGIEEGTNRWMRKHGVPKRVRGDRAREISKGLTQILRHTAPRLNIAMGADGFVDMGALLRAPRFWNEWVTEEEIIDVIHYNLKSRFEVRPVDGTYSVRALQGHSISHVRDDLILTKLSVADTPEYAAHGTPARAILPPTCLFGAGAPVGRCHLRNAQ